MLLFAMAGSTCPPPFKDSMAMGAVIPSVDLQAMALLYWFSVGLPIASLPLADLFAILGSVHPLPLTNLFAMSLLILSLKFTELLAMGGPIPTYTFHELVLDVVGNTDAFVPGSVCDTIVHVPDPPGLTFSRCAGLVASVLGLRDLGRPRARTKFPST